MKYSYVAADINFVVWLLLLSPKGQTILKVGDLYPTGAAVTLAVHSQSQRDILNKFYHASFLPRLSEDSVFLKKLSLIISDANFSGNYHIILQIVNLPRAKTAPL